MKLGSGWIVLEENIDGVSSLVSIISPRRAFEFVSRFVTQLTVDRHATFEEKILFKKNAKSWPYSVVIERNYQGNMWCDVNPLIRAHYCQLLERKEDKLFYTYKLIENTRALDPVFKSVTKSVILTET